MRVILVDDNREDLELLSDLVWEKLQDDEIIEFEDPLAALAAAREEAVDIAFIDTDMPDLPGLELGRYLIELNPFTNIIFVSSSKDQGFDAIRMHASGYMLKQVTAGAVADELAALRYAEHYNSHKRVFAQTFGNFELFVDGRPIEFKYTKTKEVVAVLVNNRGAQTTNGEIIGDIWEDDGDPEKKLSYLRNLRQDLFNTFLRLKLDGIILKQRGSMAVAVDRIECDLYDWLEKKDSSKYTYTGEYMSQYSWSEFYHGELDDIAYNLGYDGDDDE